MGNWFYLMKIILKAFAFHNVKKLGVIMLFLLAHIKCSLLEMCLNKYRLK